MEEWKSEERATCEGERRGEQKEEGKNGARKRMKGMERIAHFRPQSEVVQ